MIKKEVGAIIVALLFVATLGVGAANAIVLKNEPIYPFKDGDYAKPHHIIVEGTNEEIGFDLGTLAKNKYGTKLGIYKDPVYAEARREYLARNWPAMLERSQGVLRAFGLPADDVAYDGTCLPYDWYDIQGGGSLGFNTCSAVVLPHEKTDTGASYVSRNFDFMAMVLWSEVMGKKAPDGAFNAGERAVVLETRPDEGYKTILVGGQELLSPYIDGINEKGLYIALLKDEAAVGSESGAPAGMDISGLSVFQVMGLLLDTCATVEEAKKEILCHHIMQVVLNTHMLIADASGDATVFEIDRDSQAYVFVDRASNEPLYVTNHPLHTFPTPDTFPEFDLSKEHNTFSRQILLRDKFATLKPPYKREDATALTDAVHCAFIDDKKAEAAPKDRTLMNTNVDLSKPNISVRFYLGDVKPVPGTNHMEDRMSEFFTFGF